MSRMIVLPTCPLPGLATLRVESHQFCQPAIRTQQRGFPRTVRRVGPCVLRLLLAQPHNVAAKQVQGIWQQQLSSAMGCAQSSNSTPDTPAAGPLEAKLVAAVLLAKRRADSGRNVAARSMKPSFNGLLMKFGAMRPGFLKMRELFVSTKSAADSRMSVDSIGSILHVAVSSILTDAIAAVRAEGNSSVDFDQFVVICTILQLQDAKSAHQYPEIKDALTIVEKAFTYFDSSADGLLERAELVSALSSGSKRFLAKVDSKKDSKTDRGKKRKARGPGDMLFDVLDLDNSGTITFQEFLLGIVKIVLSEEMAEEEEELKGLTSE